MPLDFTWSIVACHLGKKTILKILLGLLLPVIWGKKQFLKLALFSMTKQI